ncbi:PQQ-dependent oxidoreductase, gdhB family [hydrothermal vent metagenome]|uniref:PQQ-dependent oxidoreductase, gdhB family n=1 Tax=hydrothermal vent metagenome TaxID=652676 RepID=A0A3B0SH98_9ZZZZ
MTLTLRQTILAGCAALFIAGCSDNNDAVASAGAGLPPGGGGGDSALQKKLAPDAPEGQLALSVETLADGLVNPWSISFFPDGTILVTERPGRIRAVRNGVLEAEPIAGAPEVFAEGQAGLFDILPHPNYAQNNVIFLSYAYGSEDANYLRVARAIFDGEAISNLEVIYDAKPPKEAGYHFGGRLVWGPDDKLYFTVGEGSRYKEKAQDMTTSYGAVIRLNEDGSVPDDNPDFGPGSLPELYSKGHRNPQGLAYDGARDILWEHEHAAMGGDEINIIKPGANYGWPIATYGIDYNGARITPFTEYEGTEQPFKYWTPSIAPSGLAIYRGDLFGDWDGDLLIGALARTALHRVIMDGDKEAGEERYLIGERVRDVRVGPDGAIYVTTEDRGGAPVGKLLRLTPQ